MPRMAAARRASYRSEGAQQERPLRSASSDVEYSRNEMPHTESAPCSFARRAAEADESTPPLIATTVSTARFYPGGVGTDREILGGPGGSVLPLGRGAEGAGSKSVTSKVQSSRSSRRCDLRSSAFGCGFQDRCAGDRSEVRAIGNPEGDLGAGVVMRSLRLRLRRAFQEDPAAVRLDEAGDVLLAAIATADGRRDAVVGDLLLQLARAETLRGNRDAAIEYTHGAEAGFSAGDDARGLARTMRIRGEAEARSGRLDDAAATLRRGLELAERTGSVEEIGGCLINLGIVEFERGELDEAIACDLRAIEEFERVGHGSGRTTGYANVAHKLAEAGRLDEAESWCRRALELADRIGHAVSRADATDTLAAIHLKQQQYPAAAERAEEGASLYLAAGMVEQAQGAFGVAADAWERAGEDDRARAATARARDLVTA